jgi:DNA-binding XRE family transcriptional regulator
MAVKNNLKQILKDKGIKQSWLADKANVDKSTITNILKNRFNTNIEVAIKIAKVLEMRVEDIWIVE